MEVFNDFIKNNLFLAPSIATLPKQFWIIHHGALLVTLIVTFINIIFFSVLKKKSNVLPKKELTCIVYSSIATIFVIILTTSLSIINGIGRSIEHTELDNLLFHLGMGSLWAIVVSLGYFYLFFWWIFYLFKVIHLVRIRIRNNMININ